MRDVKNKVNPPINLTRTNRVSNKNHCIKISTVRYLPYNTGKGDEDDDGETDGFIFNDEFVDATDGFLHSKWLSFMERRFRIVKKLLKTD